MIPLFGVKIFDDAKVNVQKVLESGYVGEGQWVKDLENCFCKVSGAKYNLATNSGTSSLHLAMMLSGVGPGDEVITTAQTMVATSHAILMQGAIPVFADISASSGNISYDDIKSKVSDKTKAICVVDWAGYPCDMDEIMSIGTKYGITVIEDAAHSIGATYKGRSVGSVSDITCFSFQGIKHVTGGDGGMISFNNPNLYDTAVEKRWFGINRDKRKENLLGEAKWDVTELGFKYQSNNISAAIILGNLVHLDQIINERNEMVKIYRDELSDVPGITLLERNDDRKSADWLFTVLVDNRNGLIRKLKEKNIQSSVVHLRIDKNTLYRKYYSRLVNLEQFTKRHLSLPLNNIITCNDVYEVCKVIKMGW